MTEFADLGFKLIIYKLQNEVSPNHCHALQFIIYEVGVRCPHLGARIGLVYCDLESHHSLTILRVVFN